MRNDQHDNGVRYAILFQDGNETALSFFYHEFFPALAHYSFQITRSRPIAEEIASEAFVKTWRMHYKLDSYAGIKSYLYRIVHRDSIEAVNREKRNTINYRQGIPQVEADTAFDKLVRTEVCRLLHAALQELPAGSRRVILMYYLDGKTSGEIARELKLHPSTVKTQKKQGLDALRKILGGRLMRVFLLLG